MAYEKSWYFGSLSNIATNTDSAIRAHLFGYKQALLATGKWVIYGCCGLNKTIDVFTAPSSLPDATDRWQVCNDAAPGGNENNTIQSWVILYNSTLDVYITLGHVNYNLINIYFSKTAPTLNSTTTYFPIVSSIHGEWWKVGAYQSDVYSRHTTHYAYTTEGYFFIWHTSDISALDNLEIFSMLPVSPSRPADTNPWVISFANTHIDQDYYGVISQKFSKCYVPLIAPSITDCGFLRPMSYDINPVSDFTNDVSDNNINMFPILVYGGSPGKKTLKGRLQDIYWAPTALGGGTTIPSTGTIEYIKIGPFFIPGNSNLIR